MKKTLFLILISLLCLCSYVVANPDGSGNFIFPGNLGIGTTATPADNVHIFNSGDPAIIFDTGGTDWHIGIDDSNGDAFVIGTGSTVGSSNVMTIETGGDVGIGTTNPAFNLHVETSTAAEGARLGAAFIGNYNGDANDLVIAFTGSEASSTTYQLKQDDSGLTTVNAPTGGHIRWTENSATVSHAINATGFGIGTTTPSGNFHCNGTFRSAIVSAATNETQLKQSTISGKIQSDIAEHFPSETGYLGEGTIAALDINTGSAIKANQDSITLGPTAITPGILIEGSWSAINPMNHIITEGKTPVALMGKVLVDVTDKVNVGDVLIVGKNGKATKWMSGMALNSYTGMVIKKTNKNKQALVFAGHQGYQVVIDQQQKQLKYIVENNKQLKSQLTKLKKKILRERK